VVGLKSFYRREKRHAIESKTKTEAERVRNREDAGTGCALVCCSAIVIPVILNLVRAQLYLMEAMSIQSPIPFLSHSSTVLSF
jgi:hypothetical protein